MSTSMENSRETLLTIAPSKVALITRTALQSASAWVITEAVHFFNGVIDEVAVFKGELDEDDIETVMNNMEEFLPVSPLGHPHDHMGSG